LFNKRKYKKPNKFNYNLLKRLYEFFSFD